MQGKQHEHKKQKPPLQAIHGALLAAAVAAGMGLAAPQDLLPCAHAETVAERRKAEAQQRKELLTKAYVLCMHSFSAALLCWAVHSCHLHVKDSLGCPSSTAAVATTMTSMVERRRRREDALKRGGMDASGDATEQAPPPGPSAADAKVQHPHAHGAGRLSHGVCNSIACVILACMSASEFLTLDGLIRNAACPMTTLLVIMWHTQVEEGNKAREGLSASMMERLKKASGDYDVRVLPHTQAPTSATCVSLPVTAFGSKHAS